MRALRTTPRTGFTLIELLVVIAILATLAALATGTYFRVRTNAQIAADEQGVLKFTTVLNNMWSAELDDANAAFDGKKSGYTTAVDNIRAICGNDSDRARAVWLYMWTRNAFPQTFAEATAETKISVTLPSMSVATDSKLVARPTFAGLTSGSLTTDQESAILLHRILTAKGTRGQTLNDDAIGTSAKTVPNTTYQYLTDTRGRAMIFVRWATNTEINDSKAGYVKPGGSSNDPFDPRSKTLVAKWTNAAPYLDGTGMGGFPIRRRVADALHLPQIAQATMPSPGSDFASTNFLPTIMSLGSADDWSAQTLPAGNTVGITTVNESAGYIFGYKLRRQGRKGDS